MKILSKFLLVFIALTLQFSCSDGLKNIDKKGCTDPASLNYDEDAVEDDGSCKYSDFYLIDKSITTNTVLTSKKIKICGDIYVSAGLVIPEGATVLMCSEASLIIQSSGYLKAVGTANEPIVIKGESEFAGFWTGISIASYSPNNIFSHVTIRDAGTYWGYQYAGVYVTGKLSMDNTTITNHEKVGLYFNNGAKIGTFINNTFSNNETGLNLPGNLISNLDTETKYINNTNNYIFARKSTIDITSVWQKLKTPILLEELYIDAGLTINGGNKILMRTGFYGIHVNKNGYLSCAGTVTEPISIIGEQSAVGYWDGIKVVSKSPNNIFTYTTIADGGAYWGYEYSNIYLVGRLSIDNSTIKTANSYGVWLANSGQLFTNNSNVTDLSIVEVNNSFIANGTGANANCTDGCKVRFSN